MSPFLDHVFLNVRGILFVGRTAAFYQLLSQAALRAAAELSANRCRSCLPPTAGPESQSQRPGSRFSGLYAMKKSNL